MIIFEFPLVAFVFIWLITSILYILGVSDDFVYGPFQVFQAVGIIVVSFVVGYFIGRYFRKKSIPNSGLTPSEPALIRILGYLWLTITIFQLIVFRGSPLIWLFLGDGRSYVDFGLPSLNGFANALLLFLASYSICRFYREHDRRWLFWPVVLIIYSALVITRQLAINFAIVVMVLFFRQKAELLKKISIGAAGLATIVLFNGFLGEIRTGGDILRERLNINASYSYMPSYSLWVYAYLCTPLNNLLHNIEVVPPRNDLSFSSTLSTLAPSIVRSSMFDDIEGNEGVRLYNSAFTVSTAFAGPWLDMGWIGVLLMSSLMGLLNGIWYKVDDMCSYLLSLLMIQVVILSGFTAFLFYLPFVFQVFWISILRYTRRNTRFAMLSP